MLGSATSGWRETLLKSANGRATIHQPIAGHRSLSPSDRRVASHPGLQFQLAARVARAKLVTARAVFAECALSHNAGPPDRRVGDPGEAEDPTSIRALMASMIGFS
jgi:hypothetical protein